MKTRDQIREEILALKTNKLLLMLPTGMGKSKIALDVTASKFPDPKRILIVYPKRTLKDNWISEFKKWGYENLLEFATFTTYNSLGKHKYAIWDMVIFDEGHHITERVLNIIQDMLICNVVILSATVKPSLKFRLQTAFPHLTIYKETMESAIDNGILPDPQIILMPLTLNAVDKTEQIIKNPKAKGKPVTLDFSRRMTTVGNKSTKFIIPCTQLQYSLDLDRMVEWYKKKAMGGSAIMKNLWLQKAGERLKWLANTKTHFVRELLKVLKNNRTLTFCCSIEQTEKVGKNCIHSKNKLADKVIAAFNDGELKHITAVAMLDEGMNLSECQIGIFANINASERMQIQRVGRILRHQNPIIIIPYYRNTREEEIVREMIEGYNKEYIHIVNNLNELCLQNYK